MMRFREAQTRCQINNCRLMSTGYGDYMVTHNSWSGKDREAKAYYSDDLEDCALTSAKLKP